jgi:2,3-bisphosphoglycerate-independent phosphoglycerate mutase
MHLDFIKKLIKPASSKIVLFVIDGLGGLPFKSDDLTELETAATPHLDQLASQSLCGLQQPIAPGITPGSGPGHLALFGYDPVKYQVGRGVLSALGINFDLKEGDVASRGNFCTIDGEGRVVDRRAGRISTEENERLCHRLNKIQLPDTQLFVQTVKEHRFLLVLRGDGLSDNIADTDPQEIGKKPIPLKGPHQEDEKTFQILSEFLKQTEQKLSDQHPANMVLLRGFSKRPDWPTVKEVFGINAAAIAAYPMYRGVARLAGMEVIQPEEDMKEEIALLEKHWEEHDFFYLHFKKTDSAGEDGDFDRKVQLIEKADTWIPRIMDLKPEVVIVTGDHSTPAALKIHSWHPVPVLLWSTRCRPDTVARFSERECVTGGLGPNFPAVDLMPLALGNAMRLEKFGA